MQAGKLRHYVAIQANTPTQDETGGEVASWAAVTNAWASIEPMGGSEQIAAGDVVNASATHKITIRAWQGLTPAHRIAWTSTVTGSSVTRTFDINSISEWQTRDVVMVLVCTEQLG